MKNKVLFVATIDLHFQAFHLPYLKWFKEQGWQVHVAASGEIELPYVDKRFTIPIQRSPFNKINLKAYKQLKKIISLENYQLIHCHTPMGGVLTRLAARVKRETGSKVIYTAHGFHFCKGAPIQNWLLYYPIEKFLSRYTDCLITINHEDFNLAKSHHFKSAVIEHVHGVGVNTEVYKPIGENQKNLLREKYGYDKSQFLLFYAAEFNQNKNQKWLIECLSNLKKTVSNVKLLLAGDGDLVPECMEFAEMLGVKEMVEFLGYRNDIEQLLKISDVAVSSSLREGLPVNIMEAMACGLPIVATSNRGHRELVIQGYNGWVIENHDIVQFARKLERLAKNRDLKILLGQNGRNIIFRSYSLQNVLEEKKKIYQLFMEGMEEAMWVAH